MTTYLLLSTLFIAAFIFPFFPGFNYDLIRKVVFVLLVSAIVWDGFAYQIRDADKLAQER